MSKQEAENGLSSKNYKAVIWVNNNPMLSVSDDLLRDALIIGNGNKYLRPDEFSLKAEDLARIDSKTQLIFRSHGEDFSDQCVYVLEDADGELKDYTSIEIIKKIFGNFTPSLVDGISLHITSCYAGLGADKIKEQLDIYAKEGQWLKSSIFLHGGNEMIRGHRSLEVLNIILSKNSSTEESVVQSRFDLFEEFSKKTPGDMSFFHTPSFQGGQALYLSNKYVADNLNNITAYISKTWAGHCQDVDKFTKENKLAAKLSDECKIDTFQYLRDSIIQGASEFYQLIFPICMSYNDSTIVKVEGDANVSKFVDDMYSLVEQSTITKTQYDELVAIMFKHHTAPAKVEGPAFLNKLVFKLSSAHQMLFSKGFDIAEVKYNGDLFFNSFISNFHNASMLKPIFNYEKISCKSLNVKDKFGYPLVCSLLQHPDALEMMKVILPKVNEPLDLNLTYSNNMKVLSLVLWHKDAVEILDFLLSKDDGKVDASTTSFDGVKEIPHVKLKCNPIQIDDSNIWTIIIAPNPKDILKVLVKHGALSEDQSQWKFESYTKSELTKLLQSLDNDAAPVVNDGKLEVSDSQPQGEGEIQLVAEITNDEVI